MTIVTLARSAADFLAVRALIEAYVEWLGLDLSFQDYDEEMHDLAARYRPPGAAMFLGLADDGRPVGCCGFVPLRADGACELKRLFVRPGARGSGAGRALLSVTIAQAERVGYGEMLLDTLPTMTGALKLYETFGFERTAPYYTNPIAEALFLRKALGRT